MSTTPTASPELPDLDKLETLAHAANPGPWKWWTSNSVLRLSAADGIDGGVLHAYSHRGHADICCGESDRAFIAAANPAAVLALIALARRAQPEGEAPQADLEQLNGGMHDSIFVKVWGDAGGGDAGRRKLAEYAYALGKRASASLSPLCGAQHAESGKEVAVPGWEQRINAVAPALRVKTKEQAMEAEIAGWRALASQQAAAPGSLEGRLVSVDVSTGDEDYANRIFAELTGETGSDGMTLIAVEKSRNFSAPGTPEAPADLPRLYRFDCYVGKTKMAAGVGVHASTMKEAEKKARKLIDKEETIKFESNQPCHPTRKCSICANYERAAQLDGGQEGSASNG